MNIEEISIKKMEAEIEAINKKYNVYISSRGAEVSVRTSFIRHFEKTHGNVEVKRLSLTSEENRILQYSADTYAEVEKICSKYITDQKEQRLSQLRFGMPYSMWEDEAKKMKTDRYGIIHTVPIPVIEKLLIDKTKNYVTISVDSSGNFRGYRDELRQLNEYLFLITGSQTNIPEKDYNESIESYNIRIAQMNPTMKITAFKNGNMRIAFNNSYDQQALRGHYIRNEIAWIRNARKA